MKMKKFLLLFLFAIILSACAQSHFMTDSADKALPLNSSIFFKKLDNGLETIVLENNNPANTISLKLIVKAGSMHEQEDQKGIAHLVEHMAFNGTEKYPSNTIIERQEELGMVFGRDVNASTSYEQTTYYLHLPSNDLALLDEAFLMLSQQAFALSFEQHELEKERPVVEEEWRRQLSMRARLGKERQKITMQGSRYLERSPIGDMELVRHVDASRVKAYWDDWYQPNNIQLVAVGAVTPDQIETLTRKYFGKIESKELPSKPDTTIPLREELVFQGVTDKELSTESISIIFRKKVSPLLTVNNYREQLVRELASYTASDLLRYQFQAGGEHLSHFSMMSGPSLDNHSDTRYMAVLREDNYMESLQEMLNAISRQAAYGVTDEDLSPVREVLITRLKGKLEAMNNTLNAQHLNTISRQLYKDLPLTDERKMANLGIELLNDIRLSEVNLFLKELLTQQQPMIIALVKSENLVTLPSIDTVNDAWKKQLKNPPLPVKGISVDPSLFTRDLPDVEIKSYKVQNKTHIWTLANNTEIWFEQSTKKNDQLIISWEGEGGTESLPDVLRRPAQLATQTMHRFGYAGFDPLQLEVLNAGESINLGASLNQYQHQISGSSSVESFAAWMHNFYLQITEPEVNVAIWETKKQLMLKGIKGASKSPQSQFNKQLSEVLYANNPVLQSLSEAELSVITAGQLLQAWESVYSFADNHKLLIVGNADPELIINIASRYIGNLAQGTGKVVKELPELNMQTKTLVVENGIEPKAHTQLYWVVKQEYSESLRREVSILARVMGLKLREQLREQSAGVYTSRFNITTDRHRDQLLVSLSYDHDPKRSSELKTAALRVINDVINNGITEQELNLTRNQIKKGLNPDKITDGKRLSWMRRNVRTKSFASMPEDYLHWLEGLTVEKLNRLAKTQLTIEPTIDAKLVPEKN